VNFREITEIKSLVFTMEYKVPGKLTKYQQKFLKKKAKKDWEDIVKKRAAIVVAANKIEDHLGELPSFQVYKKDKLTFSLTTQTLEKVDETTRDWIMDLTIRNMKTKYEESSWGWQESEKREELFEEDNIRYLIAKDEEGKCIAYAHFRFDMEQDDEVLYVYELQLEKEVRRQGLGRFMMKVLEFLAWRADMRKIMLTFLKANEGAVALFKQALGYDTDETSPEDNDIMKPLDFEILCKFNKKKLQREIEQMGLECCVDLPQKKGSKMSAKYRIHKCPQKA